MWAIMRYDGRIHSIMPPHTTTKEAASRYLSHVIDGYKEDSQYAGAPKLFAARLQLCMPERGCVINYDSDVPVDKVFTRMRWI